MDHIWKWIIYHSINYYHFSLLYIGHPPGGPPVGPRWARAHLWPSATADPVATAPHRHRWCPTRIPNTGPAKKKSLEATRPHQRDGMYRLCIYTMWGPQDSVQLVQTTPITMVYASYNYTYWCLYTWKFPKLRVSPAIIHFKFGVSMKLTIQLLGSPIYGNPSYIHMYIYIFT